MRQQLILNVHDELIVDNFAGGGGASTGIELALGRHVDHAINHDMHALAMHRINHPQTVHHCEDVFDINPAKLTEGRRVGLGWFSPDCKHFSKAKGGRPLSKKIRGLAFVILRWAAIRTRVIYMENVEEIQTWGPLLENGKPNQKHKGRTWRSFLAALSTGVSPDSPDLDEMLEVLGDTVTREQLIKGFGYEVETRELRACDYGSPTIRKRLFLIGRCDGMPIVWPEPSHSNPKLKRDGNKLKPWRPVAECIDWSIPCHSIFLTKDQARAYRCKRPLAKSTLRRVAKGVDRYVLKEKNPFIVCLTHQGSDRIESISDPANTVTGAHRGEKAVVDAKFVSRFNGDHDGREDGSARNQSPDQPIATQDTSNRHAIVSANLAPFITEHANASNQRNMPADEPGRTQCAQVKGGHMALVAAHMVQKGHVHSNSQMVKGANEPMRTQTGHAEHAIVTAHLMTNTTGHPGSPANEPSKTIATGGHQALVTGTLIQTGYGEREGQQPRVPGIDKPLGTVVAGGGKHAVVAAHLTKFNTGSVGSDARQPLSTVTSGSHSPETHGGAASTHGIVAASMVKLRGDPETHAPGSRASDPSATARAGGQHHALSVAYLAQHNGGFNTTPGHDAKEPLSTVSAKGSQQQVVTGALAKYYGNDSDGQGINQPLHSVTTRDRFAFVETTGVAPMTEEQTAGAHRVAKFLRDHGVEFEGEFATVGGYVIIDLGMRMLMPRELYLAQGFPRDYVIDRAWVADPKTGDIVEIRLTKEQQIRMCGNSVCPDVAKALVRANNPELCIIAKDDRYAAYA